MARLQFSTVSCYQLAFALNAWHLLPRRGLLGARNAMLTATKGMAIMHTNFAEYGPWSGEISMRDNGSLLSFDTGPSTSYALDSIQARGKLFIGPGEDIYKGQVRAAAQLE